MKPFQFQLIKTGTPAYEAMVALRLEVLLNPIGIPRSYINAVKEADDLLLGAYDNEELIGCCILTPVSEQAVQLRQMAVASLWQKQGVGAALLCYAEKRAAENGYQRLQLHARQNVVPFYQKSGYLIVGEPFTEVDITHYKMQKPLF